MSYWEGGILDDRSFTELKGNKTKKKPINYALSAPIDEPSIHNVKRQFQEQLYLSCAFSQTVAACSHGYLPFNWNVLLSTNKRNVHRHHMVSSIRCFIAFLQTTFLTHNSTPYSARFPSLTSSDNTTLVIRIAHNSKTVRFLTPSTFDYDTTCQISVHLQFRSANFPVSIITINLLIKYKFQRR